MSWHKPIVVWAVCAAIAAAALPAESAEEEFIGPFRWARKLYNPELAPEDQLSAIARSLHTEQATLLAGSDNAQGEVDLDQWSGSTLQVGRRNWAANTLVGAPGKNYFVSMPEWDIQEGIPDAITGEYSFFPLAQQDAHLRFGYLAVDGADLSVLHGQDLSLDSVYPYDGVVVELPFRHVAGFGRDEWQKGYYRGTPPQAGIWQVPAGDTILVAQRSTANRLAPPSILDDTNPNTPAAFLFEMGAGGSWVFLMDIGKDGTIDRIITSDDEGCKPATLPVTMASGLIVSAVAAGGSPEPKVGLTPMVVSYDEPIDPVLMAINSGGPDYTSVDGVDYDADKLFRRGRAVATTEPIAGTDDDPLYQKAREGNRFSYRIPLEEGDYAVTLHFAEPRYSKAGKRVFDVRMEGQTVLDDLDLAAEAGKLTAYDVTVDVRVNDGLLNIRFRSSKKKAIVSGIMIKCLPPDDVLGPWRWARKLYDPERSLEAQLDRIGRNGDVEEAVLVSGSTMSSGQVDLEQWHGATLKDPVRNRSANTLLGPENTDFFVSLDEWDIVQGIPNPDTGDYDYFPLAQQDACWAFGYVAARGEDIMMKHGRDRTLALAGETEYDAIVVCLPFRHVAGFGRDEWQNGDYNGNPKQVGVWQVPAGLSLTAAQQDERNRLARVNIVAGTNPNTAMSFNLSVQRRGRWQLAIDMGKDGRVDSVISSSDSGNRRARRVRRVTMASGLMMSSILSGGVGYPKVGRAPMTIGYCRPLPRASFGSSYLGDGVFLLRVVNSGGGGYVGFDIYGSYEFYDLGYFAPGRDTTFEIAPPGYPTRTSWTLRKWVRSTELDPWVMRGGTHVFSVP